MNALSGREAKCGPRSLRTHALCDGAQFRLRVGSEVDAGIVDDTGAHADDGGVQNFRFPAETIDFLKLRFEVFYFIRCTLQRLAHAPQSIRGKAQRDARFEVRVIGIGVHLSCESMLGVGL
jgi:hypothetical protein